MCDFTLNVNTERCENAHNLHCSDNNLTCNDVCKYIATKSNENPTNVNVERSEDLDNVYCVNKRLTCNDVFQHISKKPIEKFKNLAPYDNPHLHNYLINNNLNPHDNCEVPNYNNNAKVRLCPSEKYEFTKNSNGKDNVKTNLMASSNPQEEEISQKVGNKLKLQFLNVGGLSSKLKFPDIYDFVNNADITGLVETKLKLTDVNINDKCG